MPDVKDDFPTFVREVLGVELTPSQKELAQVMVRCSGRRFVLHPGGPNFGKRAYLDFVEKAARDAGLTVVRMEPDDGR